MGFEQFFDKYQSFAKCWIVGKFIIHINGSHFMISRIHGIFHDALDFNFIRMLKMYFRFICSLNPWNDKLNFIIIMKYTQFWVIKAKNRPVISESSFI